MQPRISIILPVYNEEKSITPLFKEIKEEVEKVPDQRFELIFINDGSTDKSLMVMKKILDKYKGKYDIKIFSLTKNSGKTEVLNLGFQRAIGDYVVTLDTDLQDNPKYLINFIRKIKKDGCQMVVGYRKKRYTNNLLKRISSKLANYVIKLFFGQTIHDINCGFKIMTKEAAKSLFLKSDYHRFIPVIAMANGFNIGELEIEQRKRKYGASKYGKTGLKRGINMFFDLLTLVFILKFKIRRMY